MTFLRVLRALRIFKLVRLVRASRLYQRWKAKMTLSYGSQTVLHCLFMLLFGTHWFACILALEATLHTDVQNTWVGLYGLCDDHLNTTAVFEWHGGVLPWEGDGAGPLAGCERLGLPSFYLSAITMGLLIITATGATDYYPSAVSDYETLIIVFLVLVGAGLWTMIIAAFVDVAANGDPAETTFRQQLDGLNAFIAFNNLPPGMARRLRGFMLQQKGLQLREELGKSTTRPLFTTTA